MRQKHEFVRATAVLLTPLLELKAIVVAVRVLDEIGVRVAALHCDRWVKRTGKSGGEAIVFCGLRKTVVAKASFSERC